jgi:hypothetical protein
MVGIPPGLCSGVHRVKNARIGVDRLDAFDCGD